MSSEPEQSPQPSPESDEKQLCLSCLFPNEELAHFCSKCGAPMSSYAATGPFEHLLAEGFVYREAAERPRRFIVVLGVWIIFGAMGLGGAVLILAGLKIGWVYAIFGAFSLFVSSTMIYKSTRSYFSRPQIEGKPDA